MSTKNKLATAPQNKDETKTTSIKATPTTFDIINIKEVDSKTQLIVFGFVRRIEALLAKNINIPSEIVRICFSILLQS